MTGETANGPLVVTLPIEIDFTNADEAEAELLGVTDYHNVVIADMSGTTFCDSMGVRMLTVCCKRAEAAGSVFLLVVPRGGAVARMMAITGVDQIVPVYGSLDDAIAAAPGSQPAGPERLATQ